MLFQVEEFKDHFISQIISPSQTQSPTPVKQSQQPHSDQYGWYPISYTPKIQQTSYLKLLHTPRCTILATIDPFLSHIPTRIEQSLGFILSTIPPTITKLNTSNNLDFANIIDPHQLKHTMSPIHGWYGSGKVENGRGNEHLVKMPKLPFPFAILAHRDQIAVAVLNQFSLHTKLYPMNLRVQLKTDVENVNPLLATPSKPKSPHQQQPTPTTNRLNNIPPSPRPPLIPPQPQTPLSLSKKQLKTPSGISPLQFAVLHQHFTDIGLAKPSSTQRHFFSSTQSGPDFDCFPSQLVELMIESFTTPIPNSTSIIIPTPPTQPYHSHP